MANWGRMDQAAGLRALFGIELAPTLAFSSGNSEGNCAAVLLKTARNLAASGHSVLLIDENRGVNSLSKLLRVKPRADLFDVVAGDVFASEALTPLAPRIQLLAAGRAAREFELGEVGLAARIDSILREIRNEVSYVLVDSALHRGGLSQLVNATEHLVVNTTPQGVAIKNAYAFIKHVAQAYRRDSMLVTVTNARQAAEARSIFDNMRDTARRHLGLNLDYLDAFAGSETVDVSAAIGQYFPRTASAWEMPAYSPKRRAAPALGMV